MASFKNMDTHFVSYNYFCFCFCVEFWKFIHGNDQRNCHARSSKKGKLNYYYYFSWKDVYLGIKFFVNTEFWSSLTRLGNIMKTIIITEVLHNKEKCGHSKEFGRKAFFQLNFLQVLELDRQMFLGRTPVGRGLQKRRAGVRGLLYSRAVCNWVSKRIWKCIRFAYLALWFDEENWRSTNQIQNWKPSLIAHSPKLFLIRFFRNVHLVKRLCMKLWVLMLTERSCFTCKAPNYELLAVVSDFKWYNCKYTHAFVLERMRNSSTVWGCYTAS